MNPKLRYFLIVTLKNALNALMTNIVASTFWPQLFSVHTKAGWIAIAKLVGTVVGTRELTVWGPVLMQWTLSSTSSAANGSGSTSSSTTATGQIGPPPQKVDATKWEPFVKKETK